jgi:glutaryl-CoA dehydrogenase
MRPIVSPICQPSSHTPNKPATNPAARTKPHVLASLLSLIARKFMLPSLHLCGWRGSRLTTPSPFVNFNSFLPDCLPLIPGDERGDETETRSSSVVSISSSSIPCSPTTSAWSATPPAVHRRQPHPHHRGVQPRRPLPRELVKPMADLGFFGASLKGYGCAGMSNVEYGLVMQELERGDSGVRSFVSVQSALACIPSTPSAATSRKQTWLPAMQKGEKLGCFGLTEPDFGSNPGGMRTRARKSATNMSSTAKRCGSPPAPSPTSPSSGPRSKTKTTSSRLPGRNRPPRLQGRRHSRQVVAARLGDVGLVAAGRAHPGIEPAARLRRPEISADVPEPGPLRHRLGSDRRGHGLLRLRAAIRLVAQAVPRPAHRLASTRAGKAGLDDQRDHQSAVARAASRTPERQRQGQAQHISMAKRNNVWMALECARMSRDILGATASPTSIPSCAT